MATIPHTQVLGVAAVSQEESDFLANKAATPGANIEASTMAGAVVEAHLEGQDQEQRIAALEAALPDASTDNTNFVEIFESSL